MRRVASTAAEEAVLEEELLDDDEELVAIGLALGAVIAVLVVAMVAVSVDLFAIVFVSHRACSQLTCRRGSCMLWLYLDVFTKENKITRDNKQSRE
jgi:hypothetical protein